MNFNPWNDARWFGMENTLFYCDTEDFLKEDHKSMSRFTYCQLTRTCTDSFQKKTIYWIYSSPLFRTIINWSSNGDLQYYFSKLRWRMTEESTFNRLRKLDVNVNVKNCELYKIIIKHILVLLSLKNSTIFTVTTTANTHSTMKIYCISFYFTHFERITFYKDIRCAIYIFIFFILLHAPVQR